MATAENLRESTVTDGEEGATSGGRRLVDRLTLVAAVVEPLLLYPQAVGILVHHDARAVFLPTWCGVCAMTALWVWYAVVHRDRTVLVYQGLFLLADVLVVLGALRYGGSWS